MLVTLQEFLQGAYPIMVLDCEAVGLHGETFAYGYTCINAQGVIGQAQYACPSETARGDQDDRLWVQANVPPLVISHANPPALREQFWLSWMTWKDKGAVLAADVNWPVESNFISACVADSPQNRKWKGPYPLLDIAAVLWAAGINPLQTHPRLEGELPAHDPLNDSTQSARLLLEAIRKLTSTT